MISSFQDDFSIKRVAWQGGTFEANVTIPRDCDACNLRITLNVFLKNTLTLVRPHYVGVLCRILVTLLQERCWGEWTPQQMTAHACKQKVFIWQDLDNIQVWICKWQVTSLLLNWKATSTSIFPATELILNGSFKNSNHCRTSHDARSS